MSETFDYQPFSLVVTENGWTDSLIQGSRAFLLLITCLLFPVITWVLSQYKVRLSMYGDFHYKDKTAVKLPYFHNWNAYAGKTASLY